VRLARLEVLVGRTETAVSRYEDSHRIYVALLQLAPGFAQTAEEKEIIEAELAACRAQLSSRP